MQNVQLISLSNSLVPEADSSGISIWPGFSIPKLKNLKKPFVIFSTYEDLKDKKDDLVKLKGLTLFKGLVLSIEPKLHTLSGTYLLKGLSKSIADKIHTFEDEEVVKRIVHAWRIGAQNDLIADFAVDSDGEMFVLSCDFQIYKCSYGQFESLKDMGLNELEEFKIDKFGRNIHWPSRDIHLDIFSFKGILDEKYKKELISKNLKHYKDLGIRMEVFRKEKGLTQKDFDLGDRQIRRFENGEEFPSIKALQSLANSYGIEFGEYLEQLYNIEL